MRALGALLWLVLLAGCGTPVVEPIEVEPVEIKVIVTEVPAPPVDAPETWVPGEHDDGFCDNPLNAAGPYCLPDTDQ